MMGELKALFIWALVKFPTANKSGII